jgi:hypothetical protein
MYSLFGTSKEGKAAKRPESSTCLQDPPQYSPEEINDPRSTNYWLWGWTLSITGRILTIGGVVLIFVVGSYSPFWRFAPIDLLLKTRQFGLPFVSVGGLKLQLLGRRYRKRTARSVLAKDLRDPVVYLRPFKADLQTTHFSEVASIWRIILPDPGELWGQFPISFFRIFLTYLQLLVTIPLTEEEQLEEAFKSVGPTIAVARPDEDLSTCRSVTAQTRPQFVARAGKCTLEPRSPGRTALRVSS